jgi:anti-sigma B factor antagonist
VTIQASGRSSIENDAGTIDLDLHLGGRRLRSGICPGVVYPHEAMGVRERYNGGCVRGRDGSGVYRMELQIAVDRRDDACIVTVSGEVDIYTSPALKAVLTGPDAEGCQRMIIDLNGVGFIDSSGLGVLVGALRRAKEAGVDLLLVSSQGTFGRILRITGLDAVFVLYATVDEALGA